MRMTVDEAIASMRQRWAHEPLDLADVRERIAVCCEDCSHAHAFVVAITPTEVRLFVEVPKQFVLGGDGTVPMLRRAHRSGYVHTLADVDRVLTRIHSWIAAHPAAQPAAKERAA
jgi:hypothetical protein